MNPCLLILAGLATTTPIQHRFLAVDESRRALHYVDESNRSNDWSVAGSFRDIQLIGDHRVALSDGAGVNIVDLKTRKIVATVRPAKARGSQSFRWLADGRLQFVTGNSLATTDALGTDLGSVPRILGARICRATSDGGWVSGVGSELVDLAPDGTVRAKFSVPNIRHFYHVAKRADGGYYGTCGYSGCALSLDAKGAVQQRFEHPTNFFFAGLQVLDNGHLVVANWAGHGPDDVRAEKKGPQLIEYTPAGQVVWTFRDPDRLGSIHHALVLDGLDPAVPHEEIAGQLKPMNTTNTPAVLARIPTANSLDGLAVFPDGAVAVATPNLNDRQALPGIVRIGADGKLTPLPKLDPGPGSERVVPFGMDAAPDGALYIADNQFFSERTPKPRSRLLCLKPDGQVRVVATGLSIANGVRVHQGFVYVTDSQVQLTNVLTSAVFRFPLDGAGLDLGSAPLQSPHLVARFDTPVNRDPFGADGIAFDTEGRCLVDFFDLGRLVRFPISPDGKAGAIETLIPDGILPSSDGLAFDAASGAVFIADPRSNSIHRWHPQQGLNIFSRRVQPAPPPGSLDLPVDVVIRQRQLLISNWTSNKSPCSVLILPLP